MKALFLISDSFGETVLRVARATTSQFERWGDLEFRTHFNIRDKQSIDSIMEEAKVTPCCFMFTMVERELHQYLLANLMAVGIPYFDIMHPAITMLGSLLSDYPLYRPGMTHQLDTSYYERINAIEFAVYNDDGKNPQGFLEADIILLGVSRTSKTPLSMYLANRGFKVANMPLIADFVVPEQLAKVERNKIIGLTVSPEKLVEVRRVRLQDLTLPLESPYAQPDHIQRELAQATSLFEQLGCKVIDVSNMAIEESAGRIISYINAQSYGM
ncbi:MAG: kinase/pyrophosphorylase [Symbiobacteriaceae bacterium]|nr:kinase/pyrophosphorylase [Symbiobacteriaceae bacterium]